ncbi:MAG: hypothetical protein Kow00108_02160 [Calditrichia bacterium]
MDLNIWDIMGPAFFECLVLVGIHSYLGLHVIKRKVIFVDLALAQIAALGTTVGFLFGILPGTTGAYWFSLGFAMVGAAIFSITRFRHEKIPQEAVIGLAYALAAAIAILVIDKAPHGAEHIKELLTGSILWVKWGTIGKAALVYSAVGIFHYIYRNKFLLISENPEAAYEAGINVRLWDFLFYVSFGIVITHSVGTAGVLLVFVFLIVPAIASILITDVLWKQLLIGWGMGLIVSVMGLYISYVADLPSGPTVVTFYGFMLVVVSLFVYVKKASNRGVAFRKIAIGILFALVITFGFRQMGNWFSHAEGDHHHQMVELDHSQEHLQSEAHQIANQDVNPLTILTRLDTLAVQNPVEAVHELVHLLETEKAPFIQEEIVSVIEKHTGSRFGYEPGGNEARNLSALKKMEAWIREHQ